MSMPVPHIKPWAQNIDEPICARLYLAEVEVLGIGIEWAGMA
jgi:hypothetical protein